MPPEGPESESNEIIPLRTNQKQPTSTILTSLPLTRDINLHSLSKTYPSVYVAEPPPHILEKHGYITPLSIHHVHHQTDTIPRILYNNHVIHLTGLPPPSPSTSDNNDNEKQPLPSTISIPMSSLTPSSSSSSLEVLQRNVTLLSAGFRRSEQSHLHHSTIGPPSTIAAAGSCLYRGISLRSLLLTNHCPDTNPLLPPRHLYIKYQVIIRGSDSNDNDKTNTTSLPLTMVMNPSSDIIIATEANGSALTHDHGYPARLIVPGWIEERSVKWVSHITVSKIAENGDDDDDYGEIVMLPPHMTRIPSALPKESYAYRQTNINSVITYPRHDSLLPLSLSHHFNDVITIRGFAHSGGGRLITRVEVSLDGGHSWNLATFDPRPDGDDDEEEDDGRWCWKWWRYNVTPVDLMGAITGGMMGIMCRAWDESNNVQPEHPTWNLYGVGTNHWYRVMITWDNSGRGGGLRVSHPVVPVGDEDERRGVRKGWMASRMYRFKSAGFGKLPLYPVTTTTTTTAAAARSHETEPPTDSVTAVVDIHSVNNNTYTIRGEKHDIRCFNIIAGDKKGILSLLPIMKEIATTTTGDDSSTNVTMMRVIIAAREENDLVMRSVLDDWVMTYPGRVRVHYVLSDAWPEGWKYSKGFVNRALLKSELFPPADDCYNIMCGPPVMLEKGCMPHLLALKHDENRIFSF